MRAAEYQRAGLEPAEARRRAEDGLAASTVRAANVSPSRPTTPKRGTRADDRQHLQDAALRASRAAPPMGSRRGRGRLPRARHQRNRGYVQHHRSPALASAALSRTADRLVARSAPPERTASERRLLLPRLPRLERLAALVRAILPRWARPISSCSRRGVARIVCARERELLPDVRRQSDYGRTFSDADDRPGAPPVVVVSSSFARREFGDPAARGWPVASC